MPGCPDRPPLHVKIEGCGYRPCPRLNWHKNRTQNLLLLPFAASFLCDFRQIKELWRKRVGIELKRLTPKSRRMMTLQLPPSSNWSQLESGLDSRSLANSSSVPFPEIERFECRVLDADGCGEPGSFVYLDASCHSHRALITIA